MGVLRFHQVTPTGGDCCAGYLVETDRRSREHTVKELIELILKEHPDDWGYIELYPVYHAGDDPKPNSKKYICSYKKGEMESQEDKNIEMYGDLRPYKITSSGGWSRMDYRFFVVV